MPESTPPFSLTPIKRIAVKDLALDQLKRYIASGIVAPGGRLPSERDLAQQLGVGRNSVREAIKVLGAVGILESRIGEGTFVAGSAGASIGRTLGLSLAVWGGTLIEIMRARQMIEVEAAGVAALQATRDEVRQLCACIDEMETHARASEVHAYLVADMTFHRLIASATHNSIVSAIAANLIDVLEAVIRDAQVEQLEPMVERGASHRDICQAVNQRDARGASAAMRKHLQYSTELWATITSLTDEVRSDGETRG